MELKKLPNSASRLLDLEPQDCCDSTELGTLSRNIERIVILEHHIIDDIRLMSVVSHCMPYSTCGMLSIEWIARIPSLNRLVLLLNVKSVLFLFPN